MRKDTLIVRGIRVAVLLATVGGPSGVFANKLVYHPLNPRFGGNANNATILITEAQLQNQFSGSSGGGTGGGAGGVSAGGSNISGPVIVINPGGTEVGSPSVGIGGN